MSGFPHGLDAPPHGDALLRPGKAVDDDTLQAERVIASMLSIIHLFHGDVGWQIYREHAPELAKYRAWRDRHEQR